MAIRISTYNQGDLYDYRNVGLRGTSNPTDATKFGEIKEIYAKAEELFNARPEAERKAKWWESPAFNLSDREKELIVDDRKKRIAEVYVKLFNHSDIILLQELNTRDDIDFLRSCLPEDSFELTFSSEIQEWKGERTDAVVLWNKHRFRKIEGKSQMSRRAAFALLQDVTTNKIIQAVSCHLEGFNLLNPKESLKGKPALIGDSAIYEALQYTSHPKADCTFIGGDFNAELNPNYLDGESKKLACERFSILTRADFVSLDCDKMTAFNSDIRKIAGRENGLAAIDHLFIRAPSFDSKVSSNQETDIPLENVLRNPSDHRPLFFEINLNK